MQNTRRWAVVGTVVAITGIAVGAAAMATDVELNDPAGVEQVVMAPAAAGGGAVAWVDGSPESADSVADSAAESANSDADSPGDPGWVDPSPESADSVADSVADSADSANGVAPAPVPAPAPAVGSGDSADSPAYVPAPRRAVPAADSSAGSADSG